MIEVASIRKGINPPVSEKKRGRSSRRKSTGRLFLTPILLVHTLVVIGPALAAIYYSFTNWNGIGKATIVWLDNYRRMFLDISFRMALLHNSIWMVVTIPVAFGLSLLAASILSQIKRGNLVYRLLIFIPYVLPSVVVAQLWRTFYDPNHGIGPWLLSHGLPGWNFAILGSKQWALFGIIVADNWRWWVFPMVILMTAMQSIPSDLYDAVRVDGANRWQEFINITIPGIRPTLIYLLVQSMAWSYTTYQYVYLLTNGSPGGSSDVLGTLILRVGLSNMDAGYASAIGVLTSIIAVGAVFLLILFRKKGWEI